MNKKNPIINTAVPLVLLICYTLKFLIPKFYALTDKYIGLLVFVCICILMLNNYDFIEAFRKKEKELFIMAALLAVTLLNLIIVHSGFGAFFTVANFTLLFYMSDKIIMNEKQIKIISSAYMLMLLIWLVIVYPKYFGSDDESLFALNTNSAATFSIYTAMIALVILHILYNKYKYEDVQKYEFVGYFIVLLFVRMIRLTLWHRARGALIILTFVILLYYVAGDRFLKHEKIYKALIYLATLGSIVFVFLYTVIGRLGVNFTVPLFYKNIFSGREDIWYEFFTYFSKKPLTGIGTNITIKSFVEFNVHNAMYDLLVIHGVVVFAGIMYFVIKRFWEFREKALNNKIAMLALCVLIAMFFESFIDVDLIWADYSVNLLVLLYVINADYSRD